MSDRCRICGAVDGRHDGAAHDNYVADMPPGGWRSVPAPLNIRNRDYLQGSGRNGSGPA